MTIRHVTIYLKKKHNIPLSQTPIMEHKPQQREKGEEGEEVVIESSFLSVSADKESGLCKEDATCKNEKSDNAEESEHAKDNGVCDDDDDQATPTGYAGDDELDDRQSSSTISGTESNFGFNGNNLHAREKEHQHHLYYTKISALEKQQPQQYSMIKSNKRQREEEGEEEEEEGPCILGKCPQWRDKQTVSLRAPITATTTSAAATTLPPIVWGKHEPPASIYISSARCLMKYFWNQQHQEERIVKDLTASTTSSATLSLVAGAEAPTGDHQHKDSPWDAHNATADQQLQRQQTPTQDSGAAECTPGALCAPPGLIWIPPDQECDKEESSSPEASVKRRKRILRRQGLSILSPRYISLEDTLAFSPLPRYELHRPQEAAA